LTWGKILDKVEKVSSKKSWFRSEEKQEKQKQNIDLSMSTNDNHSKNHNKIQYP